MMELMPLEPFCGTIKMLYYGNFFDRDEVVVENTSSKDRSIIHGAKSKMYIDSFYRVPCIDIPRVKAGSYDISAISNTRSSDHIVVSTIDDTHFERILAIKNMIDLNSEVCDDIIDNISGDESHSKYPIQYIFNEYKKRAGKLKQQKDIYRLLYAAIEMQNRYLSEQCALYQPLVIDQDNKSFIVDDSIKRIVRYDSRSNSVKMVRRKNSVFDWIPVDNDSLYIYQCLDEDGFVCDIRILFRASTDIEYQIYHEDMESADKYNEILDKNAEFSSSYFKLTDGEKNILKVYDQLEPLTPLLGRPQITIDENDVTIDYAEDDQKIIENLSNIYLCVMEPDNAITREFVRRIPVSRRNISMLSFFMTHDDYFAWIEDNFGRIISSVNFLHLNEYDNDISEDFSDKLRLITLSRYKEHLLPYVSNMYPTVNASVTSAYNASEMNNEICTNNLYKQLILNGIYSTAWGYLPSQISAVMEDLTIYGRYIADFFEKPIEINYDERKVYLPILGNGMFIIEEYSRAGMNAYYIKTAASEYILRPKLNTITVVSAIDFKTYKRSGFILLNLITTDTLQSYGYLVDTKRRDY